MQGELESSTDQGAVSLAEVTERDDAIVTVAEGRGAVHSLRSDDVSANAQRVPEPLETGGESGADLASARPG